MPRIGRAVAAGFPHHVIQKGNNREHVFFDAKDRKQYLSLLKKYSEKWESSIMAYCLMSNHIHLLTKPKSGRPFGNERFVIEIEKKLERKLLQLPKGRPRKETH